MRKRGPGFFGFVLPLVAIAMLACGSSSNGLQSITISPAAADAQDFPSGQVQFTVSGTFSGSSQAPAVSVLWWTFQPWTTDPTPLPGISVDSNGLAQCLPLGPAGTFPVWAVAPVDPKVPLSQMSGATKQVSATAQLTCP